MSALPPKADIETQSRDVRFVPKADSCTAANLLRHVPKFLRVVGVEAGPFMTFAPDVQ